MRKGVCGTEPWLKELPRIRSRVYTLPKTQSFGSCLAPWGSPSAQDAVGPGRASGRCKSCCPPWLVRRQVWCSLAVLSSCWTSPLALAGPHLPLSLHIPEAPVELTPPHPLLLTAQWIPTAAIFTRPDSPPAPNVAPATLSSLIARGRTVPDACADPA